MLNISVSQLCFSYKRLSDRSRSPLWLSNRVAFHRTRTISFLSSLTPPAIFVGLMATLWIYKCCMMIVFQNKIIYTPAIPPFARSERIESYAKSCFPVEWKRHSITSGDGTSITLAVGTERFESLRATTVTTAASQNVVILYFQG